MTLLTSLNSQGHVGSMKICTVMKFSNIYNKKSSDDDEYNII